jgi:hypothetical protein
MSDATTIHNAAPHYDLKFETSCSFTPKWLDPNQGSGTGIINYLGGTNTREYTA